MTCNQNPKMTKCTVIIPSSLTSVFVQDMRASALDCTAVSQIFEQSLTARGKHSPSRTWLRKWKTDSWIRPLFSQMLQLSHGQNSLKSWLEQFSRSVGLARQSVSQANAKQPKMNGGSSTSSQMELPLCDRESYSLKTSKDSCQQKCQTVLPFSATASRDWKAYITELRQAYSARLKSAHRTNASGCSSWPTISVNESKNSVGGSQMERNSIPLGTMAAMHGPAAPASSSTDGSRRESWATPRAGKTTDENPETWAKRQAKGDVATMPLTAQVKNWSNGRLNPRWCETLMNLPVGWTMPSCASPVTIERTSSDSSETVLFRQPRRKPSKH